jgi:hypothetical protein
MPKIRRWPINAVIKPNNKPIKECKIILTISFVWYAWQFYVRRGIQDPEEINVRENQRDNQETYISHIVLIDPGTFVCTNIIYITTSLLLIFKDLLNFPLLGLILTFTHGGSTALYKFPSYFSKIISSSFGSNCLSNFAAD